MWVRSLGAMEGRRHGRGRGRVGVHLATQCASSSGVHIGRRLFVGYLSTLQTVDHK